MTDFLRQNPFVSKEAYLWEWTIPQMKLSSFDYTHVLYMSEEEAKKRKAKHINTAEDLMNDLGIPIFDKNENRYGK